MDPEAADGLPKVGLKSRECDSDVICQLGCVLICWMDVVSQKSLFLFECIHRFTTAISFQGANEGQRQEERDSLVFQDALWKSDIQLGISVKGNFACTSHKG